MSVFALRPFAHFIQRSNHFLPTLMTGKNTRLMQHVVFRPSDGDNKMDSGKMEAKLIT